MTPRDAEDLLISLRQTPRSLDELHECVRHSGSDWSRDQLELFFLCLPQVHLNKFGAYQADGPAEDDLQEAIADAVRSFAGRPVPAAQIRARLPNHFVTTDEQVLAVARRTPGLEVFGPKLIRIAQKA